MRTQLTAFLPPPAVYAVDNLRRRYDPRMAERIRPHLTLLYDVADIDATIARCREWSGDPLRLRLSGLARWPGDEGGLYVRVGDEYGDARRFRQHLMVDPATTEWAPQVTLD